MPDLINATGGSCVAGHSRTFVMTLMLGGVLVVGCSCMALLAIGHTLYWMLLKAAAMHGVGVWRWCGDNLLLSNRRREGHFIAVDGMIGVS